MSISKDPIIKLQGYLNKDLRLNFLGGRIVTGKLLGLDNLNNQVMDEAVETLRDKDDPYKSSGQTRDLGFMVVRGSMIQTITPMEGIEVIDNPYMEES